MMAQDAPKWLELYYEEPLQVVGIQVCWPCCGGKLQCRSLPDLVTGDADECLPLVTADLPNKRSILGES